MADPECTFCDNPAESECPTCLNLYCSEHGDDVCLRCMAPESALPGAVLYRGSLLVLGVASILAIWLFIRPPEESAPMRSDSPAPTSTSIFQSTATPTAEGNRPTATPTQESLPATATTVLSPTASPTAETGGTYTVEPGDSLGLIADRFGTSVEALLIANPEITDPANINVGQVIIIP
ncbi:MAG: LysM peptidoglycan-binding domain-containing protein [Dehalococcoidia bacterium]|nr:LysM peptidoglycan-binding domain-containing protein [Dehalococcoidia bacterium]MCA9825866.1 LysM peptidoglycan-binding domain-containing protein [Dehalococcoidia bacterium]MCA9843629.1 LysM peptidoglycan-binding domain-containing protein [Dehalococcoidia bacterium]MCA9853028.1 LysM peptidoglycan-binding domain-containing protein [Dehalococcoidia bacterium]